ncbi:MAG: radical SAM protein, partial [Raoultibacter sp.]
QKLTLLDYPGKTAATVFTPGCNFRCPFCHNADLVQAASFPEIPLDEFFAFLDKRTGLLDGICITGGEPLLQPDLATFCTEIKRRGFAIKLDTNG